MKEERYKEESIEKINKCRKDMISAREISE